jgi:predicted enzyme related to lactoylglutathione lyase
MKLKSQRIILFVQDVPTVAAFYSQKLGLRLREMSADKKWADLDAGGLRIGLHNGGTQIKSKRPPKIVFYAADVKAAHGSLVKKGVQLGALKASKDLAFCDGKDPEGNPFQISNRR